MSETELPKTISPDGREIWSWAYRVKNAIDREHKANELLKGIRELHPKCGTCYLWMKSGLCPREKRNAKGRREGPSMNGIACNKHEEVAWVAELRNERQAELRALATP